MVLLSLFHGTRAVPHQIVNSFLMYKELSMICSIVKTTDPLEDKVACFMNEQLNGYAALKKARKMEQNVTFLGASYSRPLTVEERYLVEEFYERSDIECEGEFFLLKQS